MLDLPPAGAILLLDPQKTPVNLGKDVQIAAATSGHYGFSPNGRYLLYLSDSRCCASLIRVDCDGSAPLTLFSPKSGAGPGYFLMTPDSQRVVFAINEEILSVSLDGGEPTHLARAEGAEVQITMSPDGRFIAYNNIGDEARLVSIQGGTPRVVAKPTPLTGTHYQFTSDSSGVVYWTADEVYFRASVGGLGFVRLARNLQRPQFQLALAEGAVVAAQQGAETSYYLALYDGSDATPFTVTSDMTRLHSWLGSNEVKGRAPDWYVHTHVIRAAPQPPRGEARVPSSSRLAQQRSGASSMPLAPRLPSTWAIDLVSTGRGITRRLATSEAFMVIAVPTDDGSRVIVHTETGAGYQTSGFQTLYQIDLRTGLANRVSPVLPGWSNSYPSSDGRWVVFTIPASPSESLHTLRLPELLP